MAARAIWKGELKLGTHKLPVKLYSAVEDKSVRFHILDDTKRNRVKQHMVNPDSGEEVGTTEIRKGYEIEPGRFVILEDEDLAKLKPEPSRDIEISSFISIDAIPQQFYDRPYFLGPDGDQDDYFALAQALENQKHEGIAHWVMRNKSYTGALGSQDGYLVISTLRNEGQVIAADDLPKPAGRPPTKKEIELAKHLVSLLEGEFDPKDYKDEYRERVMEFIAKKAKGRAPRLAAVKTKRKTTALDSVLAKSIAALKKGKRAA
ncbi:MAG TPA: Ku protein [Pyrinomonadaceae bacterium]